MEPRVENPSIKPPGQRDMRKRYQSAAVKCEFCGTIFNTSRAYHDHAKQAHLSQVQANWILCSKCDSFLPTLIALGVHTSKLHSKAELRNASGRLACEFCTKSYLNMLDYNKHCLKDHYDLVKANWIPCPKCELFFRNERGLIKHSKQKHKGEDYKPKGSIQCSFCAKIFTTIDPMYQHANRYHLEEVEKHWNFDPNQKMYFPKTPKENRSLSSAPKIWCEFCSASVTFSYIPHANKIHFDIVEKLWHQCKLCNMFFPSESSLASHRLSKHRSGGYRRHQKFRHIERQEIKCQFCPQSFLYGRTCWAHAQRYHLDLISKIWAKCSICGKHFPTAKLLNSHNVSKHVQVRRENQMRSDERTICSFCPTTFSKESEILRHSRSQHFEIIRELWIPCQSCGQLFPTEQKAKRHQKRAHPTSIPTETCNLSEMNFDTSEEYLNHRNQQHQHQDPVLKQAPNSDSERTKNKISKCQKSKSGKRRTKSFKTEPIKNTAKHPCDGDSENASVSSRLRSRADQVITNVYEDCNVEDLDINGEIVMTIEETKPDIQSDEEDTFDISYQETEPNITSEPDLNDPNQTTEEFSSSNSLQKTRCPRLAKPFDLEKVPVDPEDFVNADFSHNANRHPKQPESCSGKGGSYPIPVGAEETIRLVSSFDKNGVETKRVQCQYCTKTHINVYIYSLHVNTDHPELAMLYWFPCDQCDRYLPNEKWLLRHKSRAHDKPTTAKTHLCDFCSSKLCSSASYYQHARVKHLEIISKTWIKCKLCPKLYPDNETVYQHIKNTHPKYFKKIQAAKKSNNETIENSDKATTSYECDFCHKKYSKKFESRFLKHVADVHRVEITNANCSFCDETEFESNTFLDQHIAKCHSDLVQNRITSTCPYCKNVFPTETRYAIHKEIESCHDEFNETKTEKDEIICPYCDLSFVKRQSYLKHLNKKHKEKLVEAKWYLCTNCQDYFMTEHGLSTHRSTCLKPKPDPVPKPQPKLEMKPISCDYCSEVFNFKRGHLLHVHKHHLENIKASWLECRGCNYYLPNQEHLRRHQAKCTGKKDKKCVI